MSADGQRRRSHSGSCWSEAAIFRLRTGSSGVSLMGRELELVSGDEIGGLEQFQSGANACSAPQLPGFGLEEAESRQVSQAAAIDDFSVVTGNWSQQSQLIVQLTASAEAFLNAQQDRRQPALPQEPSIGAQLSAELSIVQPRGRPPPAPVRGGHRGSFPAPRPSFPSKGRSQQCPQLPLPTLPVPHS